MKDNTKRLVEGAAAMVATGLTAAAVGALAPDMSVAQALASTGVARLGGVLGDFLNGDTKQVREAIQREELASIVEDRLLTRLQGNFENLKAKGTEPSVSDVTGIYAQFHACWVKSDPQKRELVRNAFVNSFSPDLYESGILTFLFSKLDSLCYGDLVLLRLIVEEHNRVGGTQAESELAHHFHTASERVQSGLSPYTGIGTNHLVGLHLKQLVTAELIEPTARHNLVTNKVGQGKVAVGRHWPMPLGIKVIELIHEAVLDEDLAKVT